MDSSTRKAYKSEAYAETRLINVVDTEGLFNTEFKESKQIIADAVRALTDGVMKFDSQFSLGFVYPYGTRFSDEDRNTINLIKTVLGDDALSKHAVLIFTHGDDFKRYNNVTFEIWLQKNPSFNDLLKECGNKYVLFDNVTTDLDVKKAQLLKLVRHLDQLSLNPFTNEMFQEAKLLRAGKIQNDKTFKLETLDITLEIIDYFKTWKTGTKVEDRIKESINSLSTILNEESSNVKINSLCKNLNYMKNELQRNKIPKASGVERLIQELKDTSAFYQEVRAQIEESFTSRLAKKCQIL
ncbi:uncharacterized protein LOC131951946 [Physella acuta]|uniref:uncharacterized protein LOC131951946 n=1 Tax=Physella acuta TaxID=109671 RepID=UPI0027DD42F7|nr:uncharacterized protein LOC131951946 [Physella acuta]